MLPSPISRPTLFIRFACASPFCSLSPFCSVGLFPGEEIEVSHLESYYTARSARLDNESSKLHLLTPHNDTVADLVDASALADFPRHDHMGNRIDTKADHVSLMDINHHIVADPQLIQQRNLSLRCLQLCKLLLTTPRASHLIALSLTQSKPLALGALPPFFLSAKISERTCVGSKETVGSSLKMALKIPDSQGSFNWSSSNALSL